MTAAARMRAYRERQREGVSVVPIAVPDEFLVDLIDGGFLSANDADDRDKVARAIERMHSALRVTPSIDGHR